MKKFLSMFLVLTMVVTALMGVMIIDVSAVTVTKDSDTGIYTIDMSAAGSFPQLGHVGKYLVKGSADETVKNYAEISEETILGKPYRKYDFEKVTVTNSTATDASSFYVRVPINGGKENTAAGEINYAEGFQIAKTDFLNIINNGKYYQITMYGYSPTGAGASVYMAVSNGGSTKNVAQAQLNAVNIKSEAGIPHKIDVVIYGDGTYLYEVLYIDGIPKTAAKVLQTVYTNENMQLVFYFAGISIANGATSGTSTAADYVFEDLVKEGGNFPITEKTQDEISENMFYSVSEITESTNTGTFTKTARTDDVITGVQDDVDKAIVTAVTNTSAGDRVAEIPAKYTTVGSIYTDKANSNVTAVDKVTGEVAEDTAALSDVLLMVNGVYVTVSLIPEWVEDPTKYTADGNKPFSITEAQDGKVTTRIRMNDYTSTAAPDSLGGIDTGFYKYTSEPRGSFTFDKGGVKYGENGYYGLNILKSETTSFQTSRYVTLEFDMYISGYDINDGGTYLGLALAKDGKDSSTRANMDSIYFVTKESDKTKTPLKSGLVLMPNAWNRVKIEFDFTQAEDGVVTARAYANGASEPEQTVKTSSADTAVSNVKDMYANGMQRIDFARLYPTKYTSVGIMNDRWYLGRTDNAGLNVSTSDIDVTGIDNITADNSTNVLSWGGTDEDSLVSAMEAKGYTPVYNYTYASSAEMDAAYDEIDKQKPVDEDDVSNQFTYSGNLINKWIVATGSYNSSAENGVSETSLCKSAKNILSITKTGENYTMVVNSSFGDTTVFPGICTSMDDILAAKPNLRTKTLSGFAVTDSGMMPRVYSLVKSGTYFTTINIVPSGEATLYYQRYGSDSIAAKFILAAFDKNKAVVGVKAKDIAELISTGGQGTDLTITNKFDTVPKGTARFRAFVFDGLSTLEPLVNASDYVDYVSAEN